MRRLGASLVIFALAATARAAADDAVEVSGLKSTVPPGWKKEKPSNALQFAVFSLTKADGDKDDTKVIIFYNGEQGMGTEEQNIKRYRGMFKAPAGDNAKVEKLKAGDHNITSLDLQGIYLFKARPFDPNAQAEEKADYRMIAAIVEGKKGPVYVRFIGPTKSVEKNKKDFDEWLKNFK